MASDPQAPIADVVPTEPMTTMPSLEEPQVPTEELSPEQVPVPEPVQTAMLRPRKPRMTDVLEEAQTLKAKEEPAVSIGETPSMEIRGDDIIIHPVDDATARRFRSLLNTPDDMDIRLPLPNLKTLDLPKMQKDYIKALNVIFDEEILIRRRGKQSIADIIEAAQEVGMDDAIIELLSRKPGQAFNDVQIARSVWIRMSYAKHLDELMTVAKEATDPDVIAKNKVDLLRFLPVAGNIEAQSRGALAEWGRVGAVIQHAGKVGMHDVGRAKSLPDLLKAYGVTEDTVDNLIAAFHALPEEHGMRQRFIKMVVQKGLDVWAEAFINSLLSSPVTDAVNILSNTLFGLLQVPERALASGIGRIRTTLFGGNPDRVYLDESFAQMQSLWRGIPIGLEAAWKAMRHEEGTFGRAGTSKVDARVDKAISGEYLGVGGTVGRAIDAYGIATRFFGSRMLLMEDEFAKGVAYRMELEARAVRAMRAAVDNGVSDDEVLVIGARILAEQDAAIVREAEDFAIMTTFQGDLPSWQTKIGAAMSHPLLKIFVPFYKTPMNILRETLKRTPFVGFSLMPGSHFAGELMAGGARADLAMSRMVLGGSIQVSIAMLATGELIDGFSITGAGPTNPKARKAWERLGLQPYSIAYRKDDGTWESYQYGRLAPVAGVLGMAADYAEYAQYEDDDNKLDGLMLNMMLSMYHQMEQYPMLQGIMQIGELFGNEWETPKDKFERAIEIISKQATSAAIGAAPPLYMMGIGGDLGVLGTGSLAGTIERGLNPQASNVMPTTEQISGNPILGSFQRGFYEAMNRAKSRNPFYSDKVPVKLNLWAEVMEQCHNGMWCFISPIRVLGSKWNNVDREIVRLGMNGVQMPRKTQKGIKLSAEEYNDMIIEMNILEDRNGNTMIEEMSELIGTFYYQDMEKPLEQMDLLKAIVNRRRNDALDGILFAFDNNLSIRKELRDEIRDNPKLPPSINPPIEPPR